MEILAEREKGTFIGYLIAGIFFIILGSLISEEPNGSTVITTESDLVESALEVTVIVISVLLETFLTIVPFKLISIEIKLISLIFQL